MSLAGTWSGLAPNAKRAAVLGGIAVAVLAAAFASTLFSPTTREDDASAREKMVRNILTDADPRALGIEALASRLERMEDRIDAVDGAIDAAKRAPAPAAAPLPEDPEVALARRAEMEELRLQIEELRAALDEARRTPAPLAPMPAAVPALPPPERPSPARAPGPARMDSLFGPPDAAAPVAPSAVPPSFGGGGALAIRTVSATPAAGGAASASVERAPRKGEVFIPAGTILSGVLLNGTDMPTAQNARQQPTPVLVRLKALAILPNRVREDVRECFLITSGYGDLASERAFLRGETLSCVRADGGVIEVALDGYAVGEDGKVGMRGRLVSKQGAMLAKAMQAGFLQSFASLFNAQPAIPIQQTNSGDGNTSQVQWQSMLSGPAVGAAAAQGAAGAMDRLANYYMDMAEQMFPVIEVDAGRGVEFILNKGVFLKIAG